MNEKIKKGDLVEYIGEDHDCAIPSFCWKKGERHFVESVNKYEDFSTLGFKGKLGFSNEKLFKRVDKSQESCKLIGMKYLVCYEAQTDVGTISGHAFVILGELTENSLQNLSASLKKELDNKGKYVTQNVIYRSITLLHG